MGSIYDKKNIRKEIYFLVKEEQSLSRVKHFLLKKLELLHLPSILDHYVNYKYLKYCQICLQNEARVTLPSLSTEVLRQVATQTFASRRLLDLPIGILERTHFQLILKSKCLLSEEDNLYVLQGLQRALAEIINECSAGAFSNSDKLSELLQLVKEKETLVYSAFQFSNLSQTEKEGENKWDKFKNNHLEEASKHELVYSECEKAVNYLTRTLNEESFLKETANKSVRTLINKLRAEGTCEKLYLNGRKTIVRKKPLMLLSFCLIEVEEMLKENVDVEEVHLIATEVIYIDSDLKKELWHGKNILVVSKRIECICPGLKWDISGVDGVAAPETKAENGREENLDGKDGANGKPGESGGYGMFIADKFVNLNFLTFNSNGGAGGKGQNGGDGGNGKNGEDGVEMPMEKIKGATAAFESPAKAMLPHARSVLPYTLKYLQEEITNMEEMWTKNIDMTTGQLEYAALVILLQGGIPQGTWSCYMRGTNAKGVRIEFAFYYENSLPGVTLIPLMPFYVLPSLRPCHARHAYIHIRGTSGTAGGLGGFGGQGGCGGEGGFGGVLSGYYLNGYNYNLHSSAIISGENGSSGKHGEDGKDGSKGTCGNNGRDIGYIDNMYWQEPLYFTPGTYKLENFDTYVNNSVWCPYLNKWRCFSTDRRDPPQPLEQPRTRQRKTKLNVAASKKKTINVSQALNMYANEVKLTSHSVQVGNLEFEQTLNDVISTSQKISKQRNKRKSMTKVKMSKPFQSKTKASIGRKIISAVFGPKISCEQLTILRFSTLEKVNAERANAWSNWDATRIHYEKHRTSTKANCSALYALLGTVNILGYYEAPNNIRNEVCNKLKKFDWGKSPKGVEYLNDCILAYFKDESQVSSKSENNPSPSPNLDKLCEQFKSNPETFDWNVVRIDKKAISEYFDFLEEPNIPLLTVDVQLIAEVYGLSLELYQTHSKTNKCIPFDPIAIEKSERAEIHIAVDENSEFCRMVPKEKRDMQEVYKTMENIVNEVYSFKKEEELREYFKTGRFGMMNLPKFSLDRDELLRIIRTISENVSDSDERLVVETAVIGWPTLLVQVFHDKMLGEGRQETFWLAFSKITEYSVRGEVDKLKAFMWVTAAFPVEKWIKEICLICAEDYFENVTIEEIKIWKEHISLLPEKLVACILQIIESCSDFQQSDKTAFIAFLKQIGNFHLNDGIDFSKLTGVSRSQWPYQLKKLYLLNQLQLLPNINWDNEKNKQSQALYFLHSLYNGKSKEVMRLLVLLQAILSKKAPKCSQITEIFSNFYGGLWDLDSKTLELLEQSKTVDDWTSSLKGMAIKPNEGRSLADIKRMVQNDSNSTLSPDDIQTVIDLVNVMEGYPMPNNFLNDFDSAMLDWNISFKKKIKGKSLNESSIKLQMEAVAMIKYAIQCQRDHSLRPTQKFAIISALYLGSRGKNLLSQIATGEGKTYVVFSIAIVLALFGEHVDIVTSSAVLAQRDATHYANIYSAFDLSVGEVTGDNQDQRVKAYQCHIVYGESTHFQRDYLLDRFYNQNIRGSRNFTNIIVDEVDSMFLDKGNSVLYLSHQPPDLDSLEQVFVFIWMNVVRTVNSGEYNHMRLHELVISSIYPTISVDDLLQFLPGAEVTYLWEWMVGRGLINETGRLLGNTKFCNNLLTHLPTKFAQVKKQLNHSIRSAIDYPGRLKVMKYLRPFVEHHLFNWVKSAYNATQLTEGKEYVVDVNHSLTSVDKNPKIMILDLDTGVDLRESQWNEGLHQFLQLKHGLRLSVMSLKAVFISNISFFCKYEKIFGLTGTIGTESDRNFLEQTYKVDFLCMPLALQKRFVEWEPKILLDISSWKREILNQAQRIVDAGRSTLIICGTVQEAEIIHGHILSNSEIPSEAVELYRRDYETFQAAEQGLEPKRVIVATNLAGRGADIKLSDELRKNGGLHVILSYLPDNLRVEQQAFGRASRCGDPGTGMLIVIDSASSGEKVDDAINLKIKRDDLEIARVSEIENYYKNVVQKEELMFESFQESYEKLTGALDKAYKYINDYKLDEICDDTLIMISGKVKEVKELCMYSFLDDWAFWLDKYSTLLVSKQDTDKLVMFDKGFHKFELDESVIVQEFQKITGRYDQVSEKYVDPGWLEVSWNFCKRTVGVKNQAQIEDDALSLVHEPGLLVKVAKIFIRRKLFKNAAYYLEKVCKEEGDHLAAQYYLLFCKLKEKEWDDVEFNKIVESLREAIDESRIRQSSYAGVVDEVKYVDTQKILHGDGYRKQKENVMKLLGIYKQSIDNMVGSERVLPSDFGSVCNENSSAYLCDYLVEEGALQKAQFKFTNDSKKIKELANSFCASEAKVKALVKKFDGKYLNPEVEKSLKQELDLPSRGDFWKMISSCLEEITEFVVIQGGSKSAGEGNENNGICEQNDFATWIKPTPFITKYGSLMSQSTPNQVILKGTKDSFKTKQKYIHLRKLGKICYEQVAYLNYDKLKILKIDKYHKVEPDTFTLISGIDEEDSAKIIGILKRHKIIDEDGTLLSLGWDKEKLKLGLEFEVYRSDIISILRSSCRYQYELLSLQMQYELINKTEKKAETFELRVSLPSRPCKDFVISAMEQGFILGLRPNPSYFKEVDEGDFFLNIFKEPLSWAKWVGNKLGISGGPSTAYFSLENLKELFPLEEMEKLKKLHEELRTKKWISVEGEIILEFGDNGLIQLSPDFEYHQIEILQLMEWFREKINENFLNQAMSIVYEAQGKLSILESPNGSLLDLDEKLEGMQDKSEFAEEVNIFTLSGFDHIIETVEEKYTWKMMFSALAVVIIGLAQIAVGIWLEFINMGACTFLAAGLIQEGIGDVIYGLMAFHSGYFSWQDWVDHKWRSVAMTAATMCIGGVIAKGIRYSKFGAKLVGDSSKSGWVLLDVFAQTGKVGVNRTIAPSLIKSFGYKVLRGCAVAGASMTVTYAYENALKKFVDHFSSQILDNTSESVKDHRISNTVSALLDKVGVIKAAEIVERCQKRVMINDEVAAIYLAQILTPVLNGLKQATDKMNRKGAFISQESTILLMLLEVTSRLMTTFAVVDALRKLKQSVNTHLNKLEKEVQREMDLEVEHEEKATERDKIDFMYRFRERTSALIRERIGGVIRYSFIEPLMNAGAEKLLTIIGRGIRGKIVDWKEAGIMRKLDKINLKINDSSDMPLERRKELQMQIVQLCSKSRDPNVIAYAVEFGGPMGVESVQALANKLGLTIIVDSDNPNIPKEFVPQNGNVAGDTIHLKHTMSSGDPNDLGHWQSASGGEVGQSRNNADCLLNAVNAELKNKMPNAKAIGRGDLAEFMRTDYNFKHYVKMGWHHTFNALGGFGGAKKYECFEMVGELGDEVKQMMKDAKDIFEQRGELRNAAEVFGEYTWDDGKVHQGPIQEIAFETIDGEQVTKYQYGVIKFEHLLNTQKRDSDAARSVREMGGLPGDEAGHITSLALGGPPPIQNLFAQNASMNKGVNRDIEKTAIDYIWKYMYNNASVAYGVLLIRNGNLRPDAHIIHFIFRREEHGQPVMEEKAYIIPNKWIHLDRRLYRNL